MARTVQDAKLGSRTARAGLASAGKPYYRALHEGLHLGYRKAKSAGKWVARWYLGDGGYKVETIAQADDTADANGTDILNFRQAQDVARKKYDAHQHAAKAPPEPAGAYTVGDAIAEYLAYLDEKKKTARDARWRAEALILPQLGNVACADLTKDVLSQWLNAAARSGPRLRTRSGEQQKHRHIDGEEG